MQRQAGLPQTYPASWSTRMRVSIESDFRGMWLRMGLKRLAYASAADTLKERVGAARAIRIVAVNSKLR